MTKAKAKTAVTTEETAVAAPEIISVKAFDADFKCRDFQFEIGGTYTAVGKVIACRNGFHAIDEQDNPFHVWDFYPIIGDDGRLTRYGEVGQSGETAVEKTEKGTKIASASITIKAELSLPDFIRRGVQALIKSTKADASSGYSATNASSGYSATNASSGDYATNASSGDYATNASSGYSATNASSGDYAKNASSGDYAKNASSGDSAKNASSGDSATNEAAGENSVIAAAGNRSLAKGAIGTWIALAEYDDSVPAKCIGFATGCIGVDGLEPDVWYAAKGGKLVAA